MADRLRALADAHGILPAFTDVTGERRETGDESRIIVDQQNAAGGRSWP